MTISKYLLGLPTITKIRSKFKGFQSYEAVFAEATKLTGTVYMDPARTNVYLRDKIKARIINGLNFTSALKAVKNTVELRNIDEAMEKDGAAMVKILRWIEQNASSGITEIDVSEKLLEFRAQGKDFIEASFETIAGYGPNGAIIHYAPHKETCATLKPKSFLLLDSGGHYLNGTTDITRTIPLGPLIYITVIWLIYALVEAIAISGPA